MAIQVVILAAGQGKRMYSTIPKVLHPLAGKPLLQHVLQTSATISSKPPIVIYGHQGEQIQAAVTEKVKWVEQKEQLGTGHALLQALPHIDAADDVLVLYGDVPLIQVDTLKQFIATTPDKAIGILSANLDNPYGYGRIIRGAKQQVTKIVEEKDASVDECAITEVNSGIYYIPANYLKKYLPTLKPANAQGEYYLTDIIHLAVNDNVTVLAILAPSAEIQGVNDRLQLITLERLYQTQRAQLFLKQGVMIADPNRFDVRGDIHFGQDVFIDVNVVFEGQNTIGNHCVIEQNCLIRNAIVHDGAHIKANSVIEEAEVGTNSVIGPFARLRPGTQLANDVHIGNFVEIKKSHINTGSKVNHLSYIGDSTVGKRVNVGAGTITCNYDGANKHQTIIEDDVHIGSDTQLVAPVRVGKSATIAAGSTVTKDVPADGLTLTHRLEQRSQKWKRPEKVK